MNIFRKDSAVPEITGIDLIRNRLRSWQDRDSTTCARTARDVCETLAKDHSRTAANDIANRMAGDAGSELAARIARGLVDQFAGVQGDTEGTTETELQAFIDGTRTPSLATLQCLAREYFNAALDIETGLLRSLNKTSRPLRAAGDYPPKVDPKSLPFYFPVDPKAPRLGPQPVNRSEVELTTSRPGWADSFPAVPVKQQPVTRPKREPFVRRRET